MLILKAILNDMNLSFYQDMYMLKINLSMQKSDF